MEILAWTVVGLITGWLASLVVRGGGYGPIGDMVLGILGAVIGGFLAGMLLNSLNAVDRSNVGSAFVAFIGAVSLIVLLRSVSGRRLA